MHILNGCEFVSPLQQILETPELSFILIYILKVVTEGLFIYHLLDFLHVIPKNMAKMSLFMPVDSIF